MQCIKLDYLRTGALRLLQTFAGGLNVVRSLPIMNLHESISEVRMMSNRGEGDQGRFACADEASAPRWSWCLLVIWLTASMAGIGMLQWQDVVAGAICTTGDSNAQGGRP